jgi:hypothetical protein
MEALLGFHVDFWDYATFAAIFIIVAAGLTAAVFWAFQAASLLPASTLRPTRSISWVGSDSWRSCRGFRR